jgi:hypothetical protein
MTDPLRRPEITPNFLNRCRPSMTKHKDTSAPLADADMAKTYRHLRFVKALFEIDDPELERALAVVMDRLAKANARESASADGALPAAQADGEAEAFKRDDDAS